MANSERSIEEAVAELEKRSRRSRSILLTGTVLIVVSLLSFAIDLNRLRTEALEQAATWKAQAATWEAKANELDVTLKTAGRAFRGGNMEEVGELLSSAQSQTRELAAAVAVAAVAAEEARAPPAPPPPSGPVLLYIRISEDEQQLAAQELETRLEAANLGGRPILVPRIGVVATTGSSSLRCYRATDCGYAGDVLRLISERMASPQVQVRDFSRPPRNVPPGTFELWLEPGPIELR